MAPDSNRVSVHRCGQERNHPARQEVCQGLTAKIRLKVLGRPDRNIHELVGIRFSSMYQRGMEARVWAPPYNVMVMNDPTDPSLKKFSWKPCYPLDDTPIFVGEAIESQQFKLDRDQTD